MRFLLTADWQADFSNLDACKRAHAQELKIIKKYGCEVHIDLGDLKNAFNPVDVDVVKFQQDRKEAIHEAVVYDITVLGNHDMSGQYAADKNWLSIFNSTSGHNISTPQVLELGGRIFACLPFRRDHNDIIEGAQQIWDDVTKLKVKRKFLLFHCDVKDARYSKLISKPSPSKITLKDLHAEKYTRCFGGHIHLRQKLSQNTMYVGNPFATDKGEIDQLKGFIVYDDDKDTTTFIPSVVPGLFSYKYIIDKKPKLIPGTTIKAVVRCKARGDYHRQLDKVASAIEHKYPDCISYVVPKFLDETTKEDLIVDPNAADIDKIKSYVKATIPVELRKLRNHAIHYLASVLGNATLGGMLSGRTIFDSVEAENVLSLKKVHFSFRDKGVLLVKGLNKDSSLFKSIGSGKTNFLSLLPVGMFGRTFKGQQSDAWANDKNDLPAKVTLHIRDDKNNKISIRRSRRPVKLKLDVNGSDQSSGRNSKKKGTQQRIEQLTGYTFDTLANAVYLDSSISSAFLTGTDKIRAELIHEFQNMERFALASKVISKELSLLREHEQEAKTNISVAEELLSTTNIDIKKAKNRRKINIAEIRQQKKEALSTLHSFKNAKRSLIAVEGVQKNSLEKKIASKRIELEELRKQIAKVEGVLEERKSYQKKFTKISKSSECPSCSQPLSDKHKKLVLKKINANIAISSKEVHDLAGKGFILSKDIEDAEVPLAKITAELDKVELNVEEAQEKYDAIKSKYTKIKSGNSEESNVISDLQKRKKKQIKIIKRNRRQLKYFVKETAFLSYAKESMGRDGLPAFLNKLLCPTLNAAAARYSQIFIDKELQVLFDVKDGHIVPSVINTHGGKSIIAQSTGEKAWAGIITSFALREISQPTNLLILDEPGHGLDVASARQFAQRLYKLRNRFETILVVSHNPVIVAELDNDNSITIVKKNHISTVQ